MQHETVLVCNGGMVVVVVLCRAAYSALVKQRTMGQNNLHSYCRVSHTLQKQEGWVLFDELLLQMPSSYADKHLPTPQSLLGTVETVGNQVGRNSRGMEGCGMQKREWRR